MKKYLFHGSYTPEGYRGLLAEGGTQRIQVAEEVDAVVRRKIDFRPPEYS